LCMLIKVAAFPANDQINHNINDPRNLLIALWHI